MAKTKTLRIVINATVHKSVCNEDIDLLQDDVIDGYTLSRNDCSGDITNVFHFGSAHIESVTELK